MILLVVRHFPFQLANKGTYKQLLSNEMKIFGPDLPEGNFLESNDIFTRKQRTEIRSKRYLETISTINEWALHAMTSKDVSKSLISSPNAQTGLDLEISHFLSE